jgi:signal peptidase I
MNFNFELILFYAVLISGVISLFDILFLAKKRKIKYAKTLQNFSVPEDYKLPILIEYARSFFPVLLLVFILRSFLFEPFRIPSGSLEPTLSIGDFILVNKYHYGLRLPVFHNKILPIYEPKRGEIIVFRWPPNPSFNFIKRVVGVPGDKISYIDKVLYVNGQKATQTGTNETDDPFVPWDVVQKEEDLLGVKHAIYLNNDKTNTDFEDIVVPAGMYFAMGDNRDNSADSRIWGFVPEANILGKASYIWLSWDGDHHAIRWKRITKEIQ